MLSTVLTRRRRVIGTPAGAQQRSTIDRRGSPSGPSPPRGGSGFRLQADATASRRLYAGVMEQSIRDTLGSARVRRGADTGLAVGLALLALVDLALSSDTSSWGGRGPLQVCLALGCTLPLAWRVRYPIATVVVITAAGGLLVGDAARGERTALAERAARQADSRAQIHQRLLPVVGLIWRQRPAVVGDIEEQTRGLGAQRRMVWEHCEGTE